MTRALALKKLGPSPGTVPVGPGQDPAGRTRPVATVSLGRSLGPPRTRTQTQSLRHRRLKNSDQVRLRCIGVTGKAFTGKFKHDQLRLSRSRRRRPFNLKLNRNRRGHREWALTWQPARRLALRQSQASRATGLDRSPAPLWPEQPARSRRPANRAKDLRVTVAESKAPVNVRRARIQERNTYGVTAYLCIFMHDLCIFMYI